MNVTREYFTDLTEKIFINLCEYTHTEIVREGLAISTAQKATDATKHDNKKEKVFGFRTDTLVHVAKIVDKLNKKKKNVKSNYEKELEKSIKKTIYDFLGDKTFTELNSLNVLPRAQVSRLKKHKEKANYYMETIGRLADYLEMKDSK